VNSKSKIDPWALWNTYYGRKSIQSLSYPRESDLSETREMLRLLEDAGILAEFEERGE
jgi:hypothetical protein